MFNGTYERIKKFSDILRFKHLYVAEVIYEYHLVQLWVPNFHSWQNTRKRLKCSRGPQAGFRRQGWVTYGGRI